MRFVGLVFAPLVLVVVGCASAASAPRSAADAGEHVAAGVPYNEWITGGARPGDALPLVVALHGKGGNAGRFESMFSEFPARARVILPHGESLGGTRYSWWSGPGAVGGDPDAYAAGVRPAVERIAAAIAELQHTKPTVGLAVVTGFSQGGAITMGLAASHPELVAAAFPMGAVLADGLLPAPGSSGPPRPYVHAFVGNRDPRLDGARSSVELFRRSGHQVQISEFEGVPHQMAPREVGEVRAEIIAWVQRIGGQRAQP